MQVQNVGKGFLLPPAQHKPGKPAMVVLSPGFGLPPEAYQDLAQEMQNASPVPLWVGIPRFLGNIPNPFQLGNQYRDLVQAAQKSGFEGQTYLGGHSLGGIVASFLAGSSGCHGLLLLGSYLPNMMKTGSLPVLTLGGELDGLTRLTRLAQAPESVVLPGVNHSQFADGRPLKGDLKAECSVEDAHAQIASVIGDFLGANSPGLPAQEADKHRSSLAQARQTSNQLMEAFRGALETEGDWGVQVQRLQVGNTPVRLNKIPSLLGFALSKPSQEKEGLVAVQRLELPFNPMDRSTQPVSADSVAVKMKLSQTPASASSANQLAWDWALNRVRPEARQRFEKFGRKPDFLADVARTNGPAWLFSRLSWSPHGLASPTLRTPADAPLNLGNMNYQKVLSPARAMEWILVDGLRPELGSDKP